MLLSVNTVLTRGLDESLGYFAVSPTPVKSVIKKKKLEDKHFLISSVKRAAFVLQSHSIFEILLSFYVLGKSPSELHKAIYMLG